MLYVGIIIGILAGIAIMACRSSLQTAALDSGIYIVKRRFEYSSGQLCAYNTIREAFENNTDKFHLISAKMTGCIMFDNLGIVLKYRSLHGHTMRFNYNMSSFDISNPPKANIL